MPRKYREKAAVFASILALSLAASQPAWAHSEDRQLLFADEFNGEELDREKWITIGPQFWVNDEQQAYIDDPAVIGILDDIPGADGGALMLRPLYQPGIDPLEKRQADFVSGRIESKGKFDFTHGRAEARIKLPDAVGVWPAFWLLGNGKWPDTGEIDIMEYVGEKDWTAVALHGPGYSGDGTPFVDRYYFKDEAGASAWRTYAVEWTADEIAFEIDGVLTYRATRKMVEHSGEWRFDNAKYLILNFAVGGVYPFKNNAVTDPYYGLPAETAEAIKTGEIAMLVDWVRVYAPVDQESASGD